MCCFSRPVVEVSGTSIYARPADGDRQFLVYSMKLAVDGDVAMVLPLPTPVNAAEDAVRFVDLSSCPRFFEDVESLYEKELAFGGPVSGAAPQSRANLAVHRVGAFEASFVPRQIDFSRLDPRFRLPDGVFEALPSYADWGFAVFKLRAPALPMATPEPGLLGRAQAALFGQPPPPPRPAPSEFHPMAFEFPRREPHQLFFPTVHVHDGSVHETARFHHTLYAQGSRGWDGWWQSDTTPSAGPLWRHGFTWLLLDQPVHKRVMHGEHPNADIVLPA